MDELNQMNDREALDEQKLNKIKVNVIRVERDNIIKKDPNDTIVENLRRYIERVVDGKC
jgi:hypothetical protein